MRYFILLLVLAFSPITFAGNEFGGGFITRDHKKLFDFFEYGITVPQIPVHADRAGYRAGIKSLGLSDLVSEKIVFKLNQIYLVSPEFSKHLYDLFITYSWQVIPIDLKRVEDVGPSPVDLRKVVLIPTALRSDISKVISISDQYISMLNIDHQVGLAFHEVVGAYIDRTTSRSDNSALARKVNAYLFSLEFHRSTFAQLKKFMVDSAVGEFYVAGRKAHTFQWPNLDFAAPEDEYTLDNQNLVSFTYDSFKTYSDTMQSCAQFKGSFFAVRDQFKTKLNSAFEVINRINSQIMERELGRFKPENRAFFIDGFRVAANGYWPEFPDWNPNSFLISIVKRSQYYVQYFEKGQQFNTPKKSVEWTAHYRYDELLISRENFRSAYRALFEKSWLKCEWSRADFDLAMALYVHPFD